MSSTISITLISAIALKISSLDKAMTPISFS
jgi:hypothetical protein